MAAGRSESAAGAETGFVISRTFDAPRDLVFRVWTEAEHLKRWFSPKGFTVIHANMDLRPGGVYHYGLRMPDGKEMWGKWVFREILAPERLVVVQSFSDPAGGLTRHPFAPNWPIEMLATKTFAEQGDKTIFTLRWSPYNATDIELKTFMAGIPGMNQGWGGTLEQLDAYLASIAAR
jgi:uncharacterized protein YndB with AHSA1/START domain